MFNYLLSFDFCSTSAVPSKAPVCTFQHQYCFTKTRGLCNFFSLKFKGYAYLCLCMFDLNLILEKIVQLYVQMYTSLDLEEY